jgi:hypothetical protein
MFVLLSGEGATDIGICTDGADLCESSAFALGPMGVVVQQLVEVAARDVPPHAVAFGCVPKPAIARRCKQLSPSRKRMGLPGAKRPVETGYFFNNARALAQMARDEATRRSMPVVAVLFRDGDGTASAHRGEWADKWRSVVDGFAVEGWSQGVPMVPKPKSEAWLLCGLKPDPYQGCPALESESGNDASPNSLKRQLWGALGVSAGEVDRDVLAEVVRSGRVDVDRISMPSFDAFRDRLRQVLNQVGW